MDYLIQEARREIRRDEQNALIKKIIPYAGAATLILCALAVAAFSANLYYTGRQERLSSRFYAALSDWSAKGVEEGKKELRAITEEDEPTFSLMASIALAGAQDKSDAVSLAQEKEKREGVVQRWLRLANRAAYPEEFVRFRELISLYDVFRAAKSEEEYDALSARIDAYLKQADGEPIWAYSAKELRGLVYMRSGKDKEAKLAFSGLAMDADAPDGVKERAAELVRILEAEAGAAGNVKPKTAS
jgi:hypothetical protein